MRLQPATDCAVRLVDAEPSDLDAWSSWCSEEKARHFHPQASADRDVLEHRLRASSGDLARRDVREHLWIIVADGERVGMASAWVNQAHACCEVGCLVGARWHGRGIGRQAMDLMIGKIFAETEVDRVVAAISAANAASVRVARVLGCTQVGPAEAGPLEKMPFQLLRRDWLQRIDSELQHLLRGSTIPSR